VDILSKREAGIIVARLVRHIQATVPLSGDKVIRQRRAVFHNDELLKVAQANLDEQGVAAFKEARAKGYGPAVAGA
jgi:hypothetical protein